MQAICKFHATMRPMTIFSSLWPTLCPATRRVRWVLQRLLARLCPLLPMLLGACAAWPPAPPAAEHSPCDAVHASAQALPVWQSVGAHLWLHAGASDALSSPANQGRISHVVLVLDAAASPPQGWLVGSGPDAATGRALACSAKQQLGVTVTDLISPRAYPESVLGAAGLPGVRHWALPAVQAAMTERCARCLKRLEAAVNAPSPLVAQVALPQHRMEGPQLGPFEVVAVELAPQEAVALLYHRASATWVLPGVVWGLGLVPQLREAQVDALLQVLDRLAQRAPTRLIPEQGAVGGADLLAHNRAYWQRLLDRVNERWHRGDSQAGTASGLSHAQALSASQDARQRDQLNAQRVWQQIENKGFDIP